MKARPDVAVMSSKGQVVVPLGVRRAVSADAGTEFVVFGQGDTIVFKKIRGPSFSAGELEGLVAENEKRLRDAGFASEESVEKLVSEAVAATRRK